MEDELRSAGLSKTESRVYVALSEIGQSSAYVIAKAANQFKANTYDALAKLVERGLVSKKEVDGKTVYEALDPSLLLDLLETKKERIANIIPELRLKQQLLSRETEVSVHTGAEALRNSFYHFLDFKEPFLTYGVPKEAFGQVKYWIGPFHKERIRRRIKMYHIYNYEAHDRVKSLDAMPLTPVRCLPELFDSQVSTNVCGDEVVLVMFKPRVKLIRIKDKDLAESYKRYFKILWKNAKKIRS